MKALKICLLSSVLLFISLKTQAQQLTQTLRGSVVDKASQTPIPGAIIQILNVSPLNATSSDANGNFQVKNLEVGKQSIKVSYLGYKDVYLQNLSLNSGKELVLTIQMEEDITNMEEVEVVAKADKNKPLNEMSTVSTRAFSVEETQKFAAAVNDPARMATSFAGVVQAGDGNNHISIRGNSPNGLLWRMEGVEIPNPNHFSNVGTSGGGISILSAQLLNNSDFSTGAFASEYGNALSGVFDLKLRKGNNQKREYTLQAGFLGLDVAAEGPFKKGYEGSYLVNYRYSTLSILGKLGVPLGDAITNFQDLSFNVFLPTKKAGSFGLFGFGGLSYQSTQAKQDSLLWKEDGFYRYNSKFFSNTGMVGASHTLLLKNQSYLKTILAVSGTQNGYYQEKMQADYLTFIKDYDQSYTQSKITLSSTYTQKLNSRNNLRSGFIVNQLGYNLNEKQLNDSSILEEKINVDGTTQSAQVFFQWQHQLNQRLSTNLGMHYFHVFLNNSWSAEPRAALKYNLNEKNTLTAGYGLHSQIQPLGVYFAQPTQTDGAYTTPNKNLGLTKAHHLVLGYDYILNSYSHIKLEGYYQHLFDVPISTDKENTYSILNSTDGYYTEALVNNGLGKNYGLELTYERFLHNNLYYLLSGSLYESKYRASNLQWYNTQFNTNYALTLTLGKEWALANKQKNRVLGFNIKSVLVGGFRYTPIDLQASLASGETEVIADQAFEGKCPDYYRLDLKVSLKRNYNKLTTTLALDLQNSTNRKNTGGQYFDATTGEIKYWYQAPLIPVLSYKLEF
ncbi:MAG: TonB-dependent receptor [Bacteroidia bacterium]|nr:TonB-dependent receptor [Bacteroidia bacterium]